MSFSYRQTIRHLSYFFSAASTFLLAACSVSPQRQQFQQNYESQTGLQFPQSLIDLACLANTFPSHFKQQQNVNNVCVTQIFGKYSEITQIIDLVYDKIDQSFISNTYPLLGIKGVHMRVFERKALENDNDLFVFVVIRHQEHDSFLTDEMNEMMSLFGPAATVDHHHGGKEMFGASAIASMIRFVRKQFGLDYLPQAIAMFEKILLHYKEKDENVKVIFSGFSAGGLYATALALYFNRPAITFSSTGVEDIVRDYYSHLFIDKDNRFSSPSIFNFAHKLDVTPRLDCQLGTLCLYHSENIENEQNLTDKELELLHLSTIFGISEPNIIQWLYQLEKWVCTTADTYSSKYGSCKRERLRWKDRMKSNTDDDETIKADL